MRSDIRGRCASNNDALKNCKWPFYFVAVPRRGERVESQSRPLRHAFVSSVTHAYDEDGAYILIELCSQPAR